MSFTKEAIFTQARSHKIFFDEALPENIFADLYELAKWAPTASNCCPLRYVFVSSPEGLQQLAAHALGGNKEKVQSAKGAVILAYDTNFYEHYPQLAPHIAIPSPQSQWSAIEKEKAAIKSAGIQAGFFIAAARPQGLDCGPMAGFNGEELENIFFPKDSWKFYFVVLLGKGDASRLYPRGQRLSFEQACVVK